MDEMDIRNDAVLEGVDRPTHVLDLNSDPPPATEDPGGADPDVASGDGAAVEPAPADHTDDD